MSHKIGVFDSGAGGISVAHALAKALPDYRIVFANDTEHMPYGTKTPNELLKLVEPILDNLIAQGCVCIVVACNTVSTTIIELLRDGVPVPLIAMEPMVKPAAELTKTGVIAVFATPATLASKRYQWLKATYASGIKVIEPDVADWAKQIEGRTLEQQRVHRQVEDVCRQGADVLVLGCTHYHWIEEVIMSTAGGQAIVLQPEQPVIEQTKRVLAQLV